MKLNDAVTALSALAQPSRLEVFRLLAHHSTDGLCAGDISKQLGIPKPTLSFHLKELSQAGLINSERSGRSITYRLHIDSMRNLLAFLSDDCCHGHPELCTPTILNSKLQTPNSKLQIPNSKFQKHLRKSAPSAVKKNHSVQANNQHSPINQSK